MDGASIEKNSRGIAAGIWCVLIPALVKIKLLVKRIGAQSICEGLRKVKGTSLSCSLKAVRAYKDRFLGRGTSLR
jgi:hypothetical protein